MLGGLRWCVAATRSQWRRTVSQTVRKQQGSPWKPFGHVEPVANTQRAHEPTESIKRFRTQRHSEEAAFFRTRRRMALGGVGIVGALWIGKNTERAPYTHRLRFLAMNEKTETTLGLQQWREVRAQFEGKILSTWHPYSVMVSRVGKRIAQVTGIRNYDWEFIVIDSPEVNAFCLPGGKVAVFTGLLHEIIANEDELAAVLAHEIGHASQRHAAEKMGTVQILLIVQLFLWAFLDLRFITDPLVHLVGALPFSRKLENEADYVGLILMTDACYDPYASPHVFRKMGEYAHNHGHAPPEFLSSHPSDASRVKRIQGQIPDVQAKYGMSCSVKY